MLDNFRFETFVDVHSNIFAEYLSSVIAKLPKENPEYRSIEERIEEGLYIRHLTEHLHQLWQVKRYTIREFFIYYR